MSLILAGRCDNGIIAVYDKSGYTSFKIFGQSRSVGSCEKVRIIGNSKFFVGVSGASNLRELGEMNKALQHSQNPFDTLETMVIADGIRNSREDKSYIVGADLNGEKKLYICEGGVDFKLREVEIAAIGSGMGYFGITEMLHARYKPDMHGFPTFASGFRLQNHLIQVFDRAKELSQRDQYPLSGFGLLFSDPQGFRKIRI